MVTRKAVAKAVAGDGVSAARAMMFVTIAAAELELPLGDFTERTAGEVEAIAAKKAKDYRGRISGK